MVRLTSLLVVGVLMVAVSEAFYFSPYFKPYFKPFFKPYFKPYYGKFLPFMHKPFFLPSYFAGSASFPLGLGAGLGASFGQFGNSFSSPGAFLGGLNTIGLNGGLVSFSDLSDDDDD